MEPPPMSPRNGLAMHRRRLPIVIGLLAGGIALMPVAFAVGRRTTTSQHAPTPATSTTAARSSPSADFIEYRDEEARFAVSFPKDWTQFKSSDPQVRLAAAANDHDSLLIRAIHLDADVTQKDLPAVKEFTDKVVTSGEGVQVVTEPRTVEVGGLPGHFYFYRFRDKASGQLGVHSHYFLFNGDTMLTVVFQVLPE